MKQHFKAITFAIALAGLTITGFQAQANPPPTSGLPPATASTEKHPAIEHAIKALEKAKHDLEIARHDFGGHRVEAIAACNQAITQLREALQYDTH